MDKTNLFLEILLVATRESVPLTSSYHPYFLDIFKVWACYITGQWGEFSVKNATLYLHILFWYFVVFAQQKNIFIIFISCFDEVSNFRNRMLTNQKPKYVIRNWLWNCMQNSNPLQAFLVGIILSRKERMF